MADRSVSVKLKAEVSDYNRKMRAAGKATEDTARSTEKVAKRANVQFRALATAILTGLPAASSAAIGVATAGAGALFAALGAVALRNNTEIRQSFEDLGRGVQKDLAQDASVLQDEFVGAADRIGQAYQDLRPELRQAFSEAQPLVGTLTEGVIDFAENAMPGMVTAVERSGPVMEGFRSLLADTGQGMGDFFDIVSEGSAETGEGIEHLGSLIEGTLTSLAPILSDLSGLWADHGDQVTEVITGLLDVVGGLTGSALPVFSTSIGIALDVLSGLLNVLEPLSGVLGPMIGTWLSLAAAIKTMGAVRGVIGNVSTSITGFGQSMKDTTKRAKAMRVGLAGVGLAAVSLIGSTGRLRPQIDAIDEGFRSLEASGRVSGEAARLFGEDLSALSEAFETVTADGLEGFAEGATKFVGDLLGIESHLSLSQQKLESFDKALAGLVQDGGLEQAGEYLRLAAEQMGVSIEELRAQMPEYNASLEMAAEKSRELGTSALQSLPGIDSLEESLTTLGDQTADTADKTDALNDAWRRLFGIALTLEEAQSAFEGGLDQIAESLTGVQEETANWQAQLLNANGSINLTTEAGRTLSEQLIAQGEDYRSLAQTAYDSALSRGQSEEQAAAAAVAASERRRSQFISEMTQIGFTEEQARQLANRYLGLPDDVLTLVQADTDQAEAAIDQLARDRTVTVTARYRAIRNVGSPFGHGPGIKDGGLVRKYANGGEVQGFPAGGVVSGPGGPRDDMVPAMLSDGEFVVNAASTARHLPLLKALNQNRFADGGYVGGAPSASGGSSNVVINVNAPNYVGSEEQLARVIRKQVRVGGGDVQKVFGR